MKFILLGLVALGIAISPLRADTAEETKLIGVIRSSATSVEKEDACRRLKLIGTEASVPAVASLLNDEHLYQVACDVLETLPGEASSAALISALKSTSGNQKLGVIHTLGEKRDAKAIGRLGDCLKDADQGIGRAAARSLGNIGGDQATRVLRNSASKVNPAVRPAIVEAQLQCALLFVRDGKNSEARSIYKRLSDAKESEHVRCAAYEGLIRTDSKGALDLVLKGLKGDSAYQSAALQMAAGVRDSKATKAYCALLPKSSTAMKAAMLSMLQQRGDVEAAPAILLAAKDTNALVRAAAYSALGSLGDAGNVSLLAEAATAKDEGEQRAARQALVTLRRGDVTRALVEGLANASAPAQLEIMRALTLRSDISAVAPLLKLAESGSEKTRHAAFQALGKLADDRHFKQLSKLMVSAPDANTRDEIRGVFESIVDRKEGAAKPNVSPIVSELNASTGDTRVAFLQVCALFVDARTRTAFRESLTNSDERVRTGARRALCSSRDAELLPDLAELARTSDDANQRSLAIEGYTRLATAAEGKALTPQKRTEYLRQILPVANRVEDKRVVLAGLGNVACSESLELAGQVEADAAVRAEAEMASLQIAKALLAADPGLATATMTRLGAKAAGESARKGASQALKQFDSGWRFAGPYRRSGVKAKELFDFTFSPERANSTNQIIWRVARGTADLERPAEVDLKDVVEGDNCAIFLRTRVFAPKKQAALLEVSSDDGIKLWVNRTLVHSNNVIRTVASGADKVSVNLRAGWNNFFAKVTQADRNCGLYIRVLNAEGAAMEGVKFDPHGGDQESETNRFETLKLSDKFYAEGANVADLNRDGAVDLIAGPFWFEGPGFTNRHEFKAAKDFDPHGYSDSFLAYSSDFNGDGWIDNFEVPFPGVEGYWYENPAGKGEVWKRHLVYPMVGNESPGLMDVDGDGRLDLIFNNDGQFGYATYDPAKPDEPWKLHAVSGTEKRFQRFTHGIGAGDINGDGRTDMLEATGWWEQPAQLKDGTPWVFHPFQFAEAASQMLVTDVDGDGLNDVICSWHCHRYGLNWFKQKRAANGEITWERQELMSGTPDTRVDTLRFSQLHSMALADMNGDGLLDIVTGKRYWAHGPHGDVEASAPAVVYWFESRREGGQARYIPHLIHDDSGIGTQVTAADANGDGRPDVVVANKKGIFVHFNRIAKP